MTVVADKPPTKAGGEQRCWRATSMCHVFPLRATPDSEEVLEELRFVVVHSSQLEAKFVRSLDKKLEREEEALKQAVPKTAFTCRADAEASFVKIRKKETFLVADLAVVVEQQRIKSKVRGRPKKGEVRERTVYRVALCGVVENDDYIVHACRQASHFVLITDHLDEAEWSDQEIFDTYQGQQAIEAKTGFRWLKSAYVAPVLLKTPRRIAALMFVFVISLMVRNHLESRMRARLAELGEEIRYYTRTRTTDRPTAEVIFDCFEAVSIVRFSPPDASTQRVLVNLDRHAQHILDILGWSNDIFTRIRKIPSQHLEGL
jgi:transposase